MPENGRFRVPAYCEQRILRNEVMASRILHKSSDRAPDVAILDHCIEGFEFGGLGSGVMFIDLDYRFNVTRIMRKLDERVFSLPGLWRCLRRGTL